MTGYFADADGNLLSFPFNSIAIEQITLKTPTENSRDLRLGSFAL